MLGLAVGLGRDPKHLHGEGTVTILVNSPMLVIVYSHEQPDA